MEKVPLTILQATVDLFLILVAADPKDPRSLAVLLAIAGRAAFLALVLAPTGRAAVLAHVQAPSMRRAEVLRADLLELVVHSHASPVGSQVEDIAALVLGGSWHVATDLE